MKKILIIFLAVLMLMLGYFFHDYQVGLKNLFNEKFGIAGAATETDGDETAAVQAYQRHLDAGKSHIRIAAQNQHYPGMERDTAQYSFLIKGKLLDLAYQDLYGKLPDTIDLNFGETLYFLENSASTQYAPQARFALQGKDDVDSLKMTPGADAQGYRAMMDRLIYEGKVEGYRIYPQKFASPRYIYPYSDFEEKYGKHFLANTHFFYHEMDYQLKELLLAFFNSEEGIDFGYPDDRRTYQELIHLGNFTGSAKPELAVVLCDQNRAANGEDKEVLFIMGYDANKQDYYVLYKKIFYSKVITRAIAYDPEKIGRQGAYAARDAAHPLQSLLVKVPGKPDLLLQYNAAFDKMQEISPTNTQIE